MTSTNIFPEITEKEMRTSLGQIVFKEALSLTTQATFQHIKYINKCLSGEILISGTAFTPSIDIRSLTFIKNKCECTQGKKGFLCVHGAALYLYYQNKVKNSQIQTENITTVKTLSNSKNIKAAETQVFKAPKAITIDGSLEFLSITYVHDQDESSLILKQTLIQNYFTYSPSARNWSLRNKHAIYTFIANNWNWLHLYYKVYIGMHFKKYLPGLIFLKMKVSIVELHSGGNNVSIFIENETISLKLINEALACSQQYIEYESKVFLITKEDLDKLNKIQQVLDPRHSRIAISNYNQVIKTSEIPTLLNKCKELDVPVLKGSQIRKELDKLNISQSIEIINPDIDNHLRSYQKSGVKWLKELYYKGLGGILADEMGLGKTIQAIALISSIGISTRKGSLLVVPASLIENWIREFKNFAPETQCVVVQGNKRDNPLNLRLCGVYIISYTTLGLNPNIFEDFEFEVVIADEGQWIKNRSTLAAKALKGIHSKARFVLTGTPIENHIEDLISIFEFILPGYLKLPPKEISKDERAWFSNHIKDQAMPYILRRTKSIVAPELPAKLEHVVYCSMTDKQKNLYKTIHLRAQQLLDQSAEQGHNSGAYRMHLFQEILRLRQVCVEPRLLNSALQSEHSAKLQAFHGIIEEIIDGGHRVLVFSQFVGALKYLKAYCESQKWAYYYLDGMTPNRATLCDAFNRDIHVPIFLISLKAGGVGLNLTGADTVLLYDPWWNPAAEAQAIDRAHRIGQLKTVTSIKLIVPNSIEEKVLALQQAKQKVINELWEMNEAYTQNLNMDVIKSLL